MSTMTFIYRVKKWLMGLLCKMFNYSCDDEPDFYELEMVDVALDKVYALLEFWCFYCDKENTGADSVMYKRVFREHRERILKELEKTTNDLIKKINNLENEYK